MTSIASSPEAQLPALPDRYDAAQKDGHFVYEGRSDDMLKVSGMWVSPVEVEAALLAHPPVLECGVVGAKDADELVAFVRLEDDALRADALVEELGAPSRPTSSRAGSSS